MKSCQVDFTALVGGALSKRAISVFCTVVALGTTCFSSPVLCAELPFVNWYRYGEEAIKTAPADIRGGSEADKARYLASKVAEKYQSMGINPNTSLMGRARAAVKYGPKNIKVGTCGNLTDAMIDAFQGGGFRSDHLRMVSGDKPHPLMQLGRGDLKTPLDTGTKLFSAILDVNKDHGGLGVVIGGKVWVVDAWSHGLEKGSFKGFEKSPFALMPLPAWGAMMNKAGYSSFTQIDMSKGDAVAKTFRDVETLGASVENVSTGGAWADPDLRQPADKRSRRKSSEAPVVPPTAGGGKFAEPAPYQGIVLWPKLAGSSWTGEINAEESNEDGHASFVYPLSFKVDSGNKIRGSFEFPMAHTSQGPVRQQIPVAGQYDSGTGKFTLTFEADYSYKETGTSLPITTAVKVAGTIKGSVNPDPNHQDLAQGEIRGSRAVKATPAGGKSVLGSSRLNGSWRLQRRD